MDTLRKLAKFSSSLLEEITTLRGGFFAFGRRLLQEGDLGTLDDALTARLYALRGGDGGGISTGMLQVLPPMGWTAILVGSLRFLDDVPYFEGTVANFVRNPVLVSNYRGGGNVDGDWECEPCGDDTFPYMFVILYFSLCLLGS